MEKLRTLKEHDEERLAAEERWSKGNIPNGIACPDCGAELVDSNPMIVMTSLPAQKHIQCLECGYKGTRYV